VTAARTAASHRSTISVVIPVKDDAAPLRRCLRALELQTRRPDELIVIDNGSADDSLSVGVRAGAIVLSCDQQGIPAAAAYGYDHASGDVVLRLDADCIPARSWVETMGQAFDRRPDIGAFTGGARFVDGLRALRVPLAFAYLAGYALMTAPALGHLPLFGSNLGFRRSAWHDVRAAVHRTDPELHDDLDLAFHIGERHRIRFLRGAAIGMSMRPFADTSSFVRRISRGLRTVLVHWPHDFPPVRWVRLAMRRALTRLGVRTFRTAS
jgi:glycosyltransferase involved in cell wall biosynthesis